MIAIKSVIPYAVFGSYFLFAAEARPEHNECETLLAAMPSNLKAYESEIERVAVRMSAQQCAAVLEHGRLAFLLDRTLIELLEDSVSEDVRLMLPYLSKNKCNSDTRYSKTIDHLQLYAQEDISAIDMGNFTRASKMNCCCVKAFAGKEFSQFLRELRIEAKIPEDCYGRCP